MKHKSRSGAAGYPDRGSRKRPAGLIGRKGWICAAREALLADGIGGVEIGKLARRLKVTRGGFYWFFRSRAQLCDELLTQWEQTSTQQFEGLLKSKVRNGMREFRSLVDLWVEEKAYDPAWDAAIRDWARTAPKVARVVHRVDERRIRVLERIFRDLGFTAREALVRARVTYYHQVGYYALGVRESQGERRRLLRYYIRALTGRAG